MSYPSYPSSSTEVYNATSNDQTTDQGSPYQELEIYVSRRAYYLCIHNYSTAGVTPRWRIFWNVKICLLWFRNEGKDWPEIIQWFGERGFQKNQKALYSLWSRVCDEVSSLT